MSGTPKHDGKTRTIPEYAERLRVSTSKIRGWLDDGSLIGVNVASGSSSRPQIVFTAEQQIAFERSRITDAKKQNQGRTRRRRGTASGDRRFTVGGAGEHIEF